MDEQHIRALLADLRSGACTEDDVITQLKALSVEDMGFARLDHHRHLRTGFPEVIFGQGKTPEHVAQIFARLCDRHPVVMATRVSPEQVAAVMAVVPDCTYHQLARLLTWHDAAWQWRHKGDPLIAVISAGTADLPVAEEAAISAETVGWPVDRIYDIGVAGLHRLLSQSERLLRASVIIVVAWHGRRAGQRGRAAWCRPRVIAVPTSVGMGANFGGPQRIALHAKQLRQRRDGSEY